MAAGGVDNNLTISRSDDNLVIRDAHEQFLSAPAGATLSSDKQTLTIPLASITGSLVLDLADSDDVVRGFLRRLPDPRRRTELRRWRGSDELTLTGRRSAPTRSPP